MQRRAEFARELMFDRELLLLDEPHSSLDPAAAELVEALVRRVADAGGAVVLVSHDRDRVDALANRSLVIDLGTVT
jgi:ABC-type transporter Mla maintaining outer membrane lipid asymmetry ATPase subunit MlaF